MMPIESTLSYRSHNPYAFPSANHKGMDLRDHFATQAMRFPDVRFASLFSHRWASSIAYRIADLMLAAREGQS